MKHNVVLEGFGIRLRPVALEDSAFIVGLRNMPHAVGKIGDSATTVEMQEKWLESYFERDNDYYFIAESLKGAPLGTIAVYDINAESRTAEIGRLVMLPKSLAFLPATILRNDFCFSELGLETLITCNVSTNKNIISCERKMGAELMYVSHADRIIGGKPVDMVYSKITKETWQERRESFAQLAAKVQYLQDVPQD